jgi:hypothetical protein
MAIWVSEVCGYGNEILPLTPFKDTVAWILKNQGLRGLYRGLGPTILGYLPTWAIYFSVYDEVKKRLGDNEYHDPSMPG